MELLKLIQNRRSVRSFKEKEVSPEDIQTILEAGIWAPSGLNNQPWKFMILERETKNKLANCTHYASIIKSSDKLILVFLDQKASYHREKDLMAIGACIQNMLLMTHKMGLGACWLGEILNKKAEVHSLLNLSEGLELAAIVALGYPGLSPESSERKPKESFIIS